jgi:solute carrier family 35, member F5
VFDVFCSIGGIVLVTWSTKDLHLDQEPLSAIWSVLGALLLALFLVLLRRRVDNEDKLNMPMFYGNIERKLQKLFRSV